MAVVIAAVAGCEGDVQCQAAFLQGGGDGLGNIDLHRLRWPFPRRNKGVNALSSQIDGDAVHAAATGGSLVLIHTLFQPVAEDQTLVDGGGVGQLIDLLKGGDGFGVRRVNAIRRAIVGVIGIGGIVIGRGGRRTEWLTGHQ